MDDELISCGVAGQTAAIPTEKMLQTAVVIGDGIGRLARDGFRRFLVAVTGDATLLFAEAILLARAQNPEIFLDVLLPYKGWIEEQTDGTRHNRVRLQADSVSYSCEEDYGDSEDICNRQLVGFGRCTVVIHGGGDKAMAALMAEARDAAQEVREIRI